MEIEVSIITVNYNGLNDTCALIDSIAFNKKLEVIVVDNGSSENEAEQISQRYPHVKTIRSTQNLGFAGGNNLGFQQAQGRYLFFVNNDTFFKDFNIMSLTTRLDSSAEIGIVCPKIRFAWDENPIQYAGYTRLSRITLRNKSIGCGEPDHGQYDTPHSTPYAHGAAMMVRREAIEKVGLMPTCYFLYYEEIDWSIMFKRAGYTIWYEPACTIYHKESKTTGQSSPLKTYYITRNRLLFVHRNCQGLFKYLSYAYLITVVFIRDLIKNHSRNDLQKATWRGVRDFFKLSID